MENLYTAYTKIMDNKTYYFVKKYLVFPEFKDVEPMQESFGMHADFNKACGIAGINDPIIREQLFNEANDTVQHGKVIDLNMNNYSGLSAAL
jgi:hypothetical protein